MNDAHRCDGRPKLTLMDLPDDHDSQVRAVVSTVLLNAVAVAARQDVAGDFEQWRADSKALSTAMGVSIVISLLDDRLVTAVDLAHELTPDERQDVIELLQELDTA